jgi:hypothetical protein
METASDHQMEYDEQLVIKLPDDAFSESTNSSNRLLLGRRERGLQRADYKRATQVDRKKRAANDEALKGVDV